ncbi:MAG: two-component sensor histidine kinase [Cryomorphaceae bacterium MED-G14]|nr:MAG: two-component sensor histidine kinase [Cryomorphaceae bacterium MED-G14]
MSRKNRIRIEIFIFSIFISSILSITSSLFLKDYDLPKPVIFSLVFSLLSFVIIYLFLSLFVKYFYNKRIKEISDQLFSQENSTNSTVTTNMDDLIDQIKKFDDKRKIELIEMREQETFRREFIGNLAHELKTPLFTSQSYILTLLNGALDDKSINKKYLKIAEKSIERLNLIVKDLDFITKLETGDNNLKKSNFDIVELINNSIEMLEISANKKNIKLIIDHEYNPPINVYADKEKIEQVIINLIENSIKYGKENGTTEIVLQDLVENKIIVRVTDNGIGVKENHLDRLFERFYRVDQSGSRSSGGSGLGLAIVKHIVDAHDEKIYVESDFGIGSEFSFTIDKSN